MSKETLRYDEESGIQLQFRTGTTAGTQKRPAMPKKIKGIPVNA